MTVLIGTTSKCWTTRSFKARSTPVYTELTPDGISSIQDAKFTPTGQGAYILATLSGSGTITQNIDFTASDGGFTLTDLDVESSIGAPHSPNFQGLYTAGVGWTNTASATNTGTNYEGIHLTQTYASARTITSVTIQFDRTIGTSGADTVMFIAGLLAGVVVFQQFSSSPGPTGINQTYSWTGSASIDELRIGENNGQCFPAPCPPGGSCTFKTATVIIANTSGQAVLYTPDAFTSPVVWSVGLPLATTGYTRLSVTSTPGTIECFDPTAGKIQVSTNYGQSWATAVSVGTPAANAKGQDVIRIGTVSLAAASGKVRKSTTFAGAFADVTTVTGSDALGIFVPRYQWNASTSNISITNPVFLLAAQALVASAALFKVDGAGTQTDITPSHAGNKLTPVSSDCAAIQFVNAARIAFLGSTGGSTYLQTTANAGSAWTDRSTVAAKIVRMRKSDTTATPALALAGPGGLLKYSPDFGATIQTRTSPTTDEVIALDILA